MIKIELTLSQFEQLLPLFEKVIEAYIEGRPGTILGQFHSKSGTTCYAVIDFLDQEKAEQIEKIKKEWDNNDD